MTFARVPLGDVADFINGVAFKPADWGESGRRILRIQNLTDPTKPFNKTNREVAKKYEVAPGDLLVSWSATLGVFVWEGPDTALVNQHIFRVEPDAKRIAPNYLRHMLADALIDMERHLHGATMKHVNRQEFLSTTIPLPPLTEQKQIARILDAADALRTKRRESLAQLGPLLQSTFLDMFGDPVTNPMGWDAVELLAIAELENGDRSSKYPSGPDVIDEGVLFLSTKNIADYHLVLNVCQFITQEKFDSLSRGKLKRNDIVITLRGTLGSCAVFDCQFDTGFINAQLLIIRPNGAETQYLHSLLSSQSMSDHFARIATGVAVKQLTGKQIGALKIPLPPLDLQHRFASIVKSSEQQKARQRAHLDELDTLFASLQSRAFRGAL